jgi:chaperonin GroES
MNIKPLHDRVAIKPMPQEDKTAGGIIIPDTAKEKPMRGEVVAVGSGGKTDSGTVIPLDVKIGDIVLFGKWGGTEVKINGQEIVIMKESDILAIVK